MSSAMADLVSAEGNRFGAYLAVPEAPNGAAIVVLQEIFGINANMRAVADSFAAKGFHAIAPDLFWRQEAGIELNPAIDSDREKATLLLKGMNQGSAIDDSLVAVAHVKSLSAVTGKVGAVGYCLGGKLAFLLSTKPGIDAAVSYYGVAIQAALAEMAHVQCKLLLHIAADDHLCPPEAQDAIAKAAAANRNRVTIIVHPGVGHGFARRGSPLFNAAAAARADEATLALLQAELVTCR